MIDFLDRHLATIITAILGLLAWANEKRKKRAEVKQVETDAVASMQSAYKTYVNDSNSKYAELKAYIDILQSKMEKLQNEVFEWKQKYYDLKRELQDFENGVNKTPKSGKK